MTTLEDLTNYWFPNDKYQEFWFDGSRDKEIFEKFNNLLSSTILDDDSFKKIILYDQVARNICRFTDQPYTYDAISLHLAENMLNNNEDVLYPIHKRIFILLPLRHSRVTNNLDIVMQRIKSYTVESDTNIIKRFRSATLKDYSLLTDTIKINASDNDSHLLTFNPSIHDEMCSLICNPISSYNVANSNLYGNIKKFLKTNNLRRIAVSLSGGVDSNVLLFILKQMEIEKTIEIVIAIHVNYNFRLESDDEANYLINWCEYLKVPIIHRKIEHYPMEIYNIVGRDFYEEETKKLRFNLYKYAIDKYNVAGICLGHHKGDLIENVFMNLFKGRDLLELFNMSPYTSIYDVPIIRPMLENHKKDIYEVANKCGIMYFKDTTPDWSFRGTMRRKIFPEIDKFDTSMLNNLMKIGKQSTELKQTFNDLAIDPVIDSLLIGKIGFRITINKNVAFNASYWNKILSTVFHGQQHCMISYKNVNAFTRWIDSEVSQTNIIRLSNGYMCILSQDKLYFFQTKLFEKIPHVDINIIDCSLKYNNWKINIVTDTTNDIRNKFTLDDLLNGKFIYTVAGPSNMLRIGYVTNHKINHLFTPLRQMAKVIPKVVSMDESKSTLNSTYHMIVLSYCNE